MTIKSYKTKEEVAVNFSKYLVAFIASKEKVHIALSGGSTPKIVFDVLASNFQEDVNWETVHLYWGDERCVDPTDDDSNYKMTVRHLISKIDIPEENIHRIKGENNPDYEANRYGELLENKLPSVNGIPQFDLVILGMGDDGHTASIFPHEIDLWNASDYCVVATHPESGQQRVSLTGQVINNAHTVTFLVTGGAKAEKFEEIHSKSGSYLDYPASLVDPNSGNLIWFVDNAATGTISI